MDATRERPLPPAGAGPALGEPAAAALVFCSSGAVLVLEILAVRLLAPYVGLTLEAYTTIIGVILTGIALGSWRGGALADRVEPRRLLGPLLVLGGALSMLVVPVVRGAGELIRGGPGDLALLLVLAAFLPPAAVLSAVTPTVAKLQLGDLHRTGSVVGRLSAWATAGALVGTFATGFVLVPLAPTRPTVLVIGGLLVATGIGLALRLGGLRRHGSSTAAGAALLAAAAGLLLGSPCDSETEYHCARVEHDPARGSGRVLVLDDLRHSYVDLADPRRLELAYTRWLAGAIDAAAPAGGRLDAVFIGGGGFTLPRWLLDVRPGSRATVLEIDPGVVDVARRSLGLRTSDSLVARIGDARTLLHDQPSGSADVVIGDAFSNVSVPWHLTTREFLADVRRALRPHGRYAVNVIDGGSLELVRAQAATLLEAFDDVALIGREGAGPGGLANGNFVLVASDRPLAPDTLVREHGVRVLDRAAVARLARGADVLTDDRAPTDQLLTPPL